LGREKKYFFIFEYIGEENLQKKTHHSNPEMSYILEKKIFLRERMLQTITQTPPSTNQPITRTYKIFLRIVFRIQKCIVPILAVECSLLKN